MKDAGAEAAVADGSAPTIHLAAGSRAAITMTEMGAGDLAAVGPRGAQSYVRGQRANAPGNRVAIAALASAMTRLAQNTAHEWLPPAIAQVRNAAKLFVRAAMRTVPVSPIWAGRTVALYIPIARGRWAPFVVDRGVVAMAAGITMAIAGG